MAGLAALLAQRAFVRASHNLRSDIGLAVYGAVLVWMLLLLLDPGTGRRRWAALMGLALYLGLESIPTIGLIMGGSAGLVLVVRWLRQPRQREHFASVLIYAAAAALACAVFVLVRLAPDVETALANYSSFMQIYGDVTGSGQLRNPLPVLQNYHLRFSLALSPVEIILMALAAYTLLRSPRSTDRWLLAVFGLAALLMLVLAPASYGYWAAFAPFWAYAIARAASRRLLLLVMIPALAAGPIFDLARSTIDGQNSQRLAEANTISDRFGPGSTILGEPLFWFTLHGEHNYMGWTAMSRYRRRFGGSFEEILQALNPDAIICWVDFDGICEQIDGLGWFAAPETVEVDSQSYLIFHRLAEAETTRAAPLLLPADPA
jgi:hypothetical protein